jgi:hypothetical protein
MLKTEGNEGMTRRQTYPERHKVMEFQYPIEERPARR